MSDNLYLSIYTRLCCINPSGALISAIIADLDDYTVNPIHDKIFDCLFDYMVTRNPEHLSKVRAICSQQVLAQNQ